MQSLTVAQLKEAAHAAIRAGEREKVAALTAEIKRRLAAAGAPAVHNPANLAALQAQRAAILAKG